MEHKADLGENAFLPAGLRSKTCLGKEHSRYVTSHVLAYEI